MRETTGCRIAPTSAPESQKGSKYEASIGGGTRILSIIAEPCPAMVDAVLVIGCAQSNNPMSSF